MAAGDTNLTMIGNLVSDPELRFTPSGAAVAKFTVASTPRYLDKNTNEWKDGDSLFLQCQIWRQAAENVAESLTKGMRVIVSGRLKQRSYETKEGEKRTVFEVEVDDVLVLEVSVSESVPVDSPPDSSDVLPGDRPIVPPSPSETGPLPSSDSLVVPAVAPVVPPLVVVGPSSGAGRSCPSTTSAIGPGIWSVT